MPPAPRDPLRARRIALALVAMIAALVLDLATKAWAWEHLRDQTAVAVIDRVLYLEFSFNTGSAFGFMGESAYARPFFLAVTLLTVGFLAALLRTLATARAYGFVAVGLVIGGALGNAHDRIVRTLEIGGEVRHGVIDWILVYYLPNTPWPNFNVADIALVIGIAMLLPFLIFHAEAESGADAGAAAQPG